ncbi:Fe-S protein assembly co-chaperone HscB [Ottowia thiooxydans]|uniref:Fe-S protein assembly co-chaperone HscB n=1 Tax=Ottowia thiooxydans TaxID=219182 RepID=UPI0003FF0697|nr:Fe-S protein assembly co-chaperone HscB [Ottowia thiooxydans]
MNLQSTDFELFDVPPRFAQDAALLDARWKELQRQVHPDKFATQGAAAQRVAMQWSARINEAYRRLKSPLKRAAYLCELNGAPIQAENNTAMPAEFLMQQMELREGLDDAGTPEELEQISQLSASLWSQALVKIERQADIENDWPAAAQTVRALMFLEKLASDVSRKRETLAA